MTATALAEKPDKLSCLGFPKPLPKITTFTDYASNAIASIRYYLYRSVLNDWLQAISGTRFLLYSCNQ
jgi:hypothetical protein